MARDARDAVQEPGELARRRGAALEVREDARPVRAEQRVQRGRRRVLALEGAPGPGHRVADRQAEIAVVVRPAGGRRRGEQRLQLERAADAHRPALRGVARQQEPFAVERAGGEARRDQLRSRAARQGDADALHLAVHPPRRARPQRLEDRPGATQRGHVGAQPARGVRGDRAPGAGGVARRAAPPRCCRPARRGRRRPRRRGARTSSRPPARARPRSPARRTRRAAARCAAAPARRCRRRAGPEHARTSGLVQRLAEQRDQRGQRRDDRRDDGGLQGVELDDLMDRSRVVQRRKIGVDIGGSPDVRVPSGEQDAVHALHPPTRGAAALRPCPDRSRAAPACTRSQR